VVVSKGSEAKNFTILGLLRSTFGMPVRIGIRNMYEVVKISSKLARPNNESQYSYKSVQSTERNGGPFSFRA